MDNHETPETTPFSADALELQGLVQKKKKEVEELQNKLANDIPKIKKLITEQPDCKQITDSDYIKKWKVMRGTTSYIIAEPNTVRYPAAVPTIEIQIRSHKRERDGEMFLIKTSYELFPDGSVKKTIAQLNTNQTKGDITPVPFSNTPDQLSDSFHQMSEFEKKIKELQDQPRT